MQIGKWQTINVLMILHFRIDLDIGNIWARLEPKLGNNPVPDYKSFFQGVPP